MHISKLKKYYFISQFNKNNIDKLDNNTAIIYRNYKIKNNLKEVIKLKNYCKLKRLKFYISNNIRLSIKLGIDGAYIPSFNRSFTHLSYCLKKNFDLIGSAHNLKEIKIKELQQVNRIFLSSLFKNNKNYLGIAKFNFKSQLSKKEIIALGGISRDNVKKLRIVNCIGFSGISYFKKKRPHFWGLFIKFFKT